MPDQANHKRHHLVLEKTSEAKPYTAHKATGGTKSVIPELNRAQHGGALNAQLQVLKPLAALIKERQAEIGLEAGLGIQIQFLSRPDAELAFEKLASEAKHKGIELLSVQEVDGRAVVANVVDSSVQLSQIPIEH